jgi:hypothetical protein
MSSGSRVYERRGALDQLDSAVGYGSWLGQDLVFLVHIHADGCDALLVARPVYESKNARRSRNWVR